MVFLIIIHLVFVLFFFSSLSCVCVCADFNFRLNLNGAHNDFSAVRDTNLLSWCDKFLRLSIENNLLVCHFTVRL